MDSIRPLFCGEFLNFLKLLHCIIGVLCSCCCLAPTEIVIPPTVVGYTGSDVILPCNLCNPGGNNVKYMQWDYVVKNNSKPILIYRPPLDVSIPENPLRGRLSLKNSSGHDFSAVIREVVMADGGQYTCSLSVFPHGVITGNTLLVVQGKSSVNQ